MEGHALHLIWIVPLVLLLAYLSSPRFRGDIAPARVRRILAARLGKNRYTVFNDLVIPAGGGSLRIDHVVVSKSGIFVIESQHHNGWISGAEFQRSWKASRFGRNRQFDNPMHLNYLQQQALAKLLDLPDSRFRALVVMTGHKGFKTPRPEKVIRVDHLPGLIQKQTHPVLSDEQVREVYKTLGDPRFKKPRGYFWLVIRTLLLAALLGGLYLAFSDDFGRLAREISHKADMKASPEEYYSDGTPRSAREKWEEKLVCAYSTDTGRCFCHEPAGGQVDLAVDRCRELAERGSVLKQ